jgi:hypothetical protein
MIGVGRPSRAPYGVVVIVRHLHRCYCFEIVSSCRRGTIYPSLKERYGDLMAVVVLKESVG